MSKKFIEITNIGQKRIKISMENIKRIAKNPNPESKSGRKKTLTRLTHETFSPPYQTIFPQDTGSFYYL